MPSTYLWKKKPVVIQAFKFSYEDMEDPDIKLPEWFDQAIDERKVYIGLNNIKNIFHGEVYAWYVKTIEGRHRINDGDYLIQGVHGELYPCKPDIFQKTYEMVALDEFNGFKVGDQIVNPDKPRTVYTISRFDEFNVKYNDIEKPTPYALLEWVSRDGSPKCEYVFCNRLRSYRKAE